MNDTRMLSLSRRQMHAMTGMQSRDEMTPWGQFFIDCHSSHTWYHGNVPASGWLFSCAVNVKDSLRRSA